MTHTDPETGFAVNVRTDPEIMEWIQNRLENVPEAEMDRLCVISAAVSVHADIYCPLGDTVRDRAYLEAVVDHFLS